MKNKLLIVFLIVAIISATFIVYSFGKEPFEGERGIIAKLEQVLKNQEDIILRLEDIRKQLDIIRVRASRK